MCLMRLLLPQRKRVGWGSGGGGGDELTKTTVTKQSLCAVQVLDAAVMKVHLILMVLTT